MNKHPWTAGIEAFCKLRHEGRSYEECADEAFAAAMFKHNCQSLEALHGKEGAEAAAVRGMLNVIAEDTKDRK